MLLALLLIHLFIGQREVFLDGVDRTIHGGDSVGDAHGMVLDLQRQRLLVQLRDQLGGLLLGGSGENVGEMFGKGDRVNVSAPLES